MKGIYRFLMVMSLVALWSCESAEDISFGLDHTVPTITFSQEKGEAARNQTYEIEIFVSDEAGLASVDVSYTEWSFQFSKKLAGEKTFTEKLQIEVPADALLEWEEVKYRNDGSTYTEMETYHKFTVVAYDVNQNKRTSYFYLKAR